MAVKYSPEKQKAVYLYSTAILTVLAITAIWHPRFPAMQDYPQHLFMARVISSYDSIDLNWNEFYTTNLELGPYSLFFLIVNPLSAIMPIESAGKTFISITVCLTTIFILGWSKFRFNDHPPWSLLLLFPFLFSQIYYMGFVNYLISIPILFLTLLVHRKLLEYGITPITTISYLVLLILLILSHPYTILVYIVMAVIMFIFYHYTRTRLVIGIIAPLVVTVLFGAWYVSTFDMTSMSLSKGLSVKWWPVKSVFEYFFLPFTGMRITNGIDTLMLALWSTITLLFLFAGFKQKKTRRLQRGHLILLLMSVSGYIILPFWAGDYSYFNLRMSIVCYFLLAIVLTDIDLGKWQSYVFITLLCCIMLMTITKQSALSAEREELLPLFSYMKKNALIYPIYLDASPYGIDKSFFYQAHAHDHFYYHIVVGGGASPSLFPSKMNPIRLKDTIVFPDISASPTLYRYILVRGQMPWQNVFSKTHILKAKYASWTLYERRFP